MVINKMRFKKYMQKKSLTFKGGRGKFKNPLIFMITKFHLFFIFPKCLHYCYIYFHCSYMYIFYNYSRTLCIKCWVSAFHTQINKTSSFYGYIERGVWRWKEDQRQGDKLWITLVYTLTYTPQNIYTRPCKCIW